MSRQPRLFPNSIDMERAGAEKIGYEKLVPDGADCGCKMCAQICWTPCACLCELPPFNLFKALCIG